MMCNEEDCFDNDIIDSCKNKSMTNMFNAPNPHMLEVARVLGDGLRPYFCHLTVTVSECPNLSSKPFYLPRSGLCGESAVVNIGSIDYLLPNANQLKIYDATSVLAFAGLRSGQVLGGGPGPYNGSAGELTTVLGINYGNISCNRSVIGCSSKNDACPKVIRAIDSCFSSWNQLFCTEGNCGKVIAIHATGRIGTASIGTMLHEALHKCYGRRDQPLALGVVFSLENSGAKATVLSDIPTDKFSCYPNLDEHLCKFEIPGPIIAVGSVFSHDPKEMDLMKQHFNCYDLAQTATGHFENDTCPEKASYKIYLIPVQKWGRIDKPVY